MTKKKSDNLMNNELFVLLVDVSPDEAHPQCSIPVVEKETVHNGISEYHLKSVGVSSMVISENLKDDTVV